MAQNTTKRVVNKAKSKAKSRARRKIKSKVRRISVWTFVISFLALVVGIAVGIGAYSFISRDDCFRLRGEAEYDIALGSAFEYDDEGVRIIEFGRDISREARVETNMTELDNGNYTVDTSAAGRYYIKYTVDSVKYGEICRIRVFEVGGEQ